MLRETGQYPEALRAAYAAIQLAPDNWRYHATYANAAAEDKDALWLAHMAAQTALSLAPDEAGAHFLAGLVAHRRNDVTAAKAAYARTLQLEPDHAAAMNNLTILDGLHHTIRASRGLAAALSNEPQSRVLRDNIAALVVRFALTLFMIGGGGVAISLAAASIGGFLARTVAGVSFTTALAWYLTRVVRRVPAGVREYARTRWRHNGRAQLYRSAAVAEIAVVYAAWLAPIPNQIRVGTLAAALVVIICGSAAVAAGRRVRFCPGGYRPLIVVVIQAIAGRQRRR
jgi:tetratricopeptide (TPR) repeat protein